MSYSSLESSVAKTCLASAIHARLRRALSPWAFLKTALLRFCASRTVSRSWISETGASWSRPSSW